MSNRTLAITIPTYNRKEILMENIDMIFDDIVKYNVSLYISDDSNNNETKDSVEKLQKKYNNIFYSKNEPSLGHDKNYIKTMSLPKEDYIWYLGDSMVIENGAIEKIINIIALDDYNYIAVNAQERKLDLESKVYTNLKEAFDEIGWHLTLTGATIYKRSTLNVEKINFSEVPNFPQLALIFKNFDGKNIFWTNQKLIHSNKKKVSYWKKDIFKVFIGDYSKSLRYIFKDKDFDITTLTYMHVHKSGLFGLTNLINLKIEGVLEDTVLSEYREVITRMSFGKRFFLMIIKIVPDFLLKRFVSLIITLR